MKTKQDDYGFVIDRPLSNPLTEEEIEEQRQRGYRLSYGEPRIDFVQGEPVVSFPTARYVFRPINSKNN